MSNAPPPMPADHQTAPRCECGHDAHPDGPCANAECRPLAVVGGKTVRVLCCESYRPATGERVDAEAAPKRKLQADVCLCSHFGESHCGPLGACIYCACKVFRSEAAPPRATTSCEHGRFAPPCGCFALRATLASSPRVDGPAGAMSGETDPYFVLDFCEGAIRDAITLEDGLDAEAGKAALDMIAAAKRARLRAAPSPEIGALVDAMELACYRHQAELTLESCVAAKTTRDAILSAFATLTARAAEAERYRFIVESRATVGFNQLLSVPRPIGSRGPWFCATDVETFHANTPDEAIDKARAALRPSGSGDTHPTETNDERVNDL